MQLLPLFIVMFFMGVTSLLATSFNNNFNDIQYQSKADISFGQALTFANACMTAGQSVPGFVGTITAQQLLNASAYTLPNVNFNPYWTCSAQTNPAGGRYLIAFMPQMSPGAISEINLNGQQDQTWNTVAGYTGNSQSYTINEYRNMVTGSLISSPTISLSSAVPNTSLSGALIRIEGVSQ